MKDDMLLREQIIQLLEGGNAHLKTMDVLTDYPMEIINSTLPNIGYSAWELLEHMRIAQYDILDFIRNPDYQMPKWPDDYWPSKKWDAGEADWESTKTSFWVDLSEAVKLANDPETDLFAPLKHAPDYTLLRELLLIADHNAYHLGQLVLIKKSLSDNFI